ncbi:873_t:CDS:2, partial [Diversispora eburnea]
MALKECELQILAQEVTTRRAKAEAETLGIANLRKKTINDAMFKIRMPDIEQSHPTFESGVNYEFSIEVQ